MGRVDPDAMLAEMDESLFQRWQAFWRAEPFGPTIVNRMMARIACSAGMGKDEDDYLPIARSD